MIDRHEAMEIIEDELPMTDEVLEAVQVVREYMSDVPAWRDRPTCAGKWWCEPQPGGALSHNPVAMNLTDSDIERGAPFHVARVYGPIPDDKSK